MRAKLFGVAALVLACALLASSGATSQPLPGGKDKGTGGARVVIPGPTGYGAPGAADADFSGFDLRQLVDELVRVRLERAALERREQMLLALIPKRIEAQRNELNDLEKRVRELQAAKERRPEGKK
jgi:hypothetical protein